MRRWSRKVGKKIQIIEQQRKILNFLTAEYSYFSIDLTVIILQ